jgi:hypothetical protein
MGSSEIKRLAKGIVPRFSIWTQNVGQNLLMSGHFYDQEVLQRWPHGKRLTTPA